MERQHKKPAANTAASSPASSGSSSSSRSIHSSMSSAFLGVSSPTHFQSQRRLSPSLCPPPAPALLPSLLASRGSAASRGTAGSSSSQFHQISPSPGTAAKRRPRPSSRLTHSLPSPFLSELAAIGRIGTNLFGDLNAQQMTQRPLLHGQQEKEMTQASSSLTMPHSHHHTPVPIGDLSGFPSALQQQQALTMRGLPGFAPPPLQQQQAQPSFSSLDLQPLPVGNFSGFPLPPSQPQQMLPSTSTDLPSRIFSGLEPLPVASQHFPTYVAPLPSRTTIFQSFSSCSADHVQPSSDSELPPLPPSLEIRHYGLPGQLSPNNGSSTVDQSRSGFMQPSSNSETYQLAPLPESLQMPPLLLQQVKQEPVVVAPCLEPEIISLDDGDELSALVHSFASSHGHGSASLPNLMHGKPTNLELEGSGSGSGLSMRGDAEGVGVGRQILEAMPMLASVHDKVNNASGSSSSSSSSIPWNCHGSMPMYSRSKEQALQQLSDLLSPWSSTVSSSTDQSMASSITGSCQGWAAVPALANKFDMISIGGSSCSARPQTPWNYSSLSVENSTPIPAMPKLKLGGMDRPGLPPRPLALGAGASSRSMLRRGCTKEHVFSKVDTETINKENQLKELVKTDPKRVKRILRNREYVARLKVQKANHLQDLQHQADALKMECRSLSAQVQLHQEMVDNLKTEIRELQIKLKGLNEQANLSQGLNDQLQSEIERLKLLEHSMLCANGIHNPKSS